jgi:hypothetical protein
MIRDNDALCLEVCEIDENRILHWEDANSLILAIRSRDLLEDLNARIEALRGWESEREDLVAVARREEVGDLEDIAKQLEIIDATLAEIAIANGRPMSSLSADPGQRRRGVRVEWPTYRALVARKVREERHEAYESVKASNEELGEIVRTLKAEAGKQQELLSKMVNERVGIIARMRALRLKAERARISPHSEHDRHYVSEGGDVLESERSAVLFAVGVVEGIIGELLAIESGA